MFFFTRKMERGQIGRLKRENSNRDALNATQYWMYTGTHRKEE